MKTLKVMTDYHCWPLWLDSGDVPDNVPPESFPITSALIEGLNEWADRFDAILVMDDPASSDFATPQDAEDFAIRGEELATKLAEELKSGYVVTYHDRRTSQVRRISQ